MKYMKGYSVLIFLAVLIAAAPATAQEARLMRFPAIYNNQVVFSYAGDLFTVDKNGGMARKLTSDIGYEMFSRFSPDGKNLAFTGQYDGNTEVFVMPAGGGAPKRVTYTATLGRDNIADRMGPNNIVMTWQDNEHIIYRSRKKTFDDFVGSLFVANVNGGLSEELPLPNGGFCSFSPDKKKMAYNRIFREFRTWKYYRGGMADDIWIYDFNSKQTINITNNPAQDIQPMWFGDKIYFLSDRDRTMNLFCYDVTTRQTKKVTNYTDYDIKFPSLGNNAIVFERAGYLYTVDLPSEQIKQVNISIASDNIYGRTEWIDASKFIQGASIGPDGKRLVMTGRGDIFTLPAENGITRNLSQTNGVHERDAAWSPDGKYIAFISDSTGEDEIYIQSPDGASKPIQITSTGDVYKYALTWSPDSKKILWSDRRPRLRYVDIDSKKITEVDTSNINELRDFSWSPDSKWITYSKQERGTKGKIYLYSLASARKTPVTDGWYDVFNPVFSNDGKYLYLASNRNFNPTFSNTDFQIAYLNMAKLYLITLAKETTNPFAPENDEVAVKKADTAKDDDKKETGKPGGNAVKDIKVDLEGITQRIVAIPVEASNYFALSPGENNRLYYLKVKDGEDQPQLSVYDLEKKKETNLGASDGFELSADFKKMVIKVKSNYYVIDAPTAKPELEKEVDLGDMKLWVDKKAEWKQIFDESWRQMRDFFYAPNMHGVNWKAMHDKYAVLVPYVNQRADLTYLIGEMIGELSVGHSYTGGGDQPKPERIPLGLLGAKLSRDASGYYRIDNILEGANYNEELRSPLTEVGVNVNKGDYIISVNGKPANTLTDVYAALVNTAGKEVELVVNSKPSPTGARKTIVVPVADESKLYYYNWVQHNIRYVDSVSGGKIGYLHIPDMGLEGLNEFMKYFYPQLNKKALIIDDRGNGGGFVSPLVTERLNRQLVYYEFARNALGTPDPEGHYGPKVLLVNEYSASDGDIFPYRFRTYKLGKIIGKRSWGGVVGIRNSLPFVDGGFLNRPEFAPYLANGFVIEGHGVDPDIVVDNDPAKEYAGVDEQLNRAISELLEELKTKEQNIPAVPPYPDKSK
ncbi:S41 family peptidase [Foetidibacter luteolus]|uniref:S41 family peptidase n=1 Tax=Foetidibacter luteolus TaxID=2608880 RepID=UPI001A980AA4|nr:S41 family peptidase [Foetidibacter luteolus]